MNSEVHPLVAGLVITTTLMAVALWAWASGVAAGFGGPAALVTGPGGHHFIEIQKYLVEHDEDGAYVRTHDLGAIDIELLLGGYAFFSDGDILLRRGIDPRSFFDNVRAYRRETNLNSIVPDEPGSGLFRCNLDTSDCSRFGDTGIDFKAAFSVFIDWQTDEVYISDTTRHLVRKYSPDGRELAPPVGDFKFPNQLMLHDGHLLVADTNNHVIRHLEPQSSSFAELIESHSVVPGAARIARQTWPSHFARVGDHWWVNNMQTGMSKGGIYVFDGEWGFVRPIQLPPDADPIALLPVGDEVWVSDWDNDVVRRFSAAGESLPDLESEGLETILAESRKERLTYTLISFAGVALVVMMLLALMVRAFALGMNKGPAPKAADADAVAARHDSAPLFFEPDEKLRKRMTLVLRFILFLTLLGVVTLAYLFRSFESPDAVLPLVLAIAGMLAIILLIAWVNKANWETSIRLDGNTLTLRDYLGRTSSSPMRDVRFDDTAIATRDVIVMLGRPQAQIYNRADLQERLLPRLGDAQRVGPIAMLKIQIQLRHPQGLVAVLALIGVIAYAAVQAAT